ncbi:MAG: helix-turn-helix transcriptional regulator [Aquidulcibacter sp.]|jgi:HTH-type transcriptional regulator/antitoxin HipB|uniref:helix-turn-helix domain-containing protein n=1 Tax=Aquidulcibacter sp. TaxID=2052990 RepID=UPI0022C2576F|nr:helix-turn-helix transcriptional regulator [Aquidulcibacter sp.]
MKHTARTPSQIGSIIRRIRTDKNMTQTDLAEKVGTVQKKISTIETGQSGARIDTICNIMAALDLDIVITQRDKSTSQNIEDIF